MTRAAPRGFLVLGVSLAGILSWTGCGERQIERYVASPPSEGALSRVLAVSSGNQIAVQVHDPSGPAEPIRATLEDGDDALLIEALLYDRSLQSLGLEPGALPPAGLGEEGAALPAEDRLYALSVDAEGTPTEWRPAGRSGPLLAFRYANKGCAPLGSDVIQPGLSGDARLSAELGDGTVVLGSRDDRRLAIVTPTEISLGEALPFPFNAGGSAGDGTVWLAGTASSGGGLYLGDPRDARSFVRLTETTTLAEVWRLQVVRRGDDTEVYTFDTAGKLRRWNGAAWLDLHDYGGPPDSPVLAYAGGDIYAAHADSRTIVRVRDGVTTTITIPPTLSGVRSVSAVEGFGVLVGTSSGQIFGLEGFTELAGSKLAVRVNTIVPAPGGFLAAGELGWVGRYSAGQYCEPGVLAPQIVFFASRLGDGRVVLSGNADGSLAPLRVAIITFP